MGQYVQAFESNDIDVDLLPKLTDEGLRQLAVASLGQRLRLPRSVVPWKVSCRENARTLARALSSALACRRTTAIVILRSTQGRDCSGPEHIRESRLASLRAS